MSTQVTFQRSASGSAAVVVTGISGTLTYGDGHDDRGGTNVPRNRAGVARNGSIDTILTDANRDAILAMQSPTGSGDYTVGAGAGDSIPAGQIAYFALVDIVVTGDSVQVARISWKGTKQS